MPEILDTGNRKEFSTGAVRDIAEGAGKGRCDLLPLSSVALVFDNYLCEFLGDFIENDDVSYVESAISWLVDKFYPDEETAIIEVSKHFEQGALKYGERNWEKGIPVHCYLDSAIRHYLKYLRGDEDEPHLNACLWNLLCLHWTYEHIPAMRDIEIPKGERHE